MLRGFFLPSAVLTRILPSRSCTQTTVACGLPSGLTVASVQNCLPSSALLTFSGSAMRAPSVGSRHHSTTAAVVCVFPEELDRGDGLGELGRELGDVPLGAGHLVLQPGDDAPALDPRGEVVHRQDEV